MLHEVEFIGSVWTVPVLPARSDAVSGYDYRLLFATFGGSGRTEGRGNLVRSFEALHRTKSRWVIGTRTSRCTAEKVLQLESSVPSCGIPFGAFVVDGERHEGVAAFSFGWIVGRSTWCPCQLVLEQDLDISEILQSVLTFSNTPLSIRLILEAIDYGRSCEHIGCYHACSKRRVEEDHDYYYFCAIKVSTRFRVGKNG